MNTTRTGPEAAAAVTAGPEVSAQVRRVQLAVRATLALGVAASVTANVLHAEPTAVGRAIAAWPPLALLLTIELITRVPVVRPWLAGTRLAATAAVAGIAAWVSYWHMSDVAARYGESASSAHLIPLSVDGLVVVASVCLVEISHHLRTTTTTTEPVPTAATAPDVEAEAEAAPTVPATTPAPAQPALPRGPRPPRTRTTTRPATGTSAGGRIARLRAAHPDWTAGQIAARAGVSDRTVRRHLNTPTTASTTDAVPSAAAAPSAPPPAPSPVPVSAPADVAA